MCDKVRVQVITFEPSKMYGEARRCHMIGLSGATVHEQSKIGLSSPGMGDGATYPATHHPSAAIS